MHIAHDTITTNACLLHILDELSAGCDAEFDAEYDDLEREFAELRLQLANS